MVKGTILWSLAPGEIARRINVNEFDRIAGAKGVYVQEGVVAVLMIDGQIVTMLTSGVYYFQTGFERFNEAIRAVWRFFTGSKKGGSVNEDEIRSGRVGSCLRNMTSLALVDVILYAEGAIPVVFGAMPTEQSLPLRPFKVRTKLEDVEVALFMHMEISDFSAFRKNYLTKQASYSIVNLQIELANPIHNLLQEQLAYETVELSVLPPALKERIRLALIEKIGNVLYGISVRQIIDITLDSKDFERFRELEHKLYTSDKELDYLTRTNDFKNRLALEENSQLIRDARTEEDLRYALQKVNQGELLHDDEMEEFCQLLANRKAIREAQTDEDREKALQNIKKSGLIREDDLDDLLHVLQRNRDVRDEDDLHYGWERFRRAEAQRIEIERDSAILTAQAMKATEQAEYEWKKQAQGHNIDLTKEKALADTELNEIGRDEQKKDANLVFYLQDEKHTRTIQEGRDYKDLEHYGQDLEVDILKKKQDIALAAQERLSEIERAEKAQQLAHDEQMRRLELESERILREAQKGMSAAQIAALGLKDLDTASRIEVAHAIATDSNLQIMQRSADEKEALLKSIIAQNLEREKDSREHQDKWMERMMDFSEKALKTNAGLVSDAVSGQRATSNDILRTVSGVATHRLDELETDRLEARADTRHAQARMDHTHDVALENATKQASAEAMSGAFRSAAREEDIPVKCPNCGNIGIKGHRCPNCKMPL